MLPSRGPPGGPCSPEPRIAGARLSNEHEGPDQDGLHAHAPPRYSPFIEHGQALPGSCVIRERPAGNCGERQGDGVSARAASGVIVETARRTASEWHCNQDIFCLLHYLRLKTMSDTFQGGVQLKRRQARALVRLAEPMLVVDYAAVGSLSILSVLGAAVHLGNAGLTIQGPAACRPRADHVRARAAEGASAGETS